jgi:hypothetical protein
MAFEGLPADAFTAAGAREDSEASGVYAVSAPTRWVFIGDSGNMRQALFELLNEPFATP